MQASTYQYTSDIHTTIGVYSIACVIYNDSQLSNNEYRSVNIESTFYTCITMGYGPKHNKTTKAKFLNQMF